MCYLTNKQARDDAAQKLLEQLAPMIQRRRNARENGQTYVDTHSLQGQSTLPESLLQSNGSGLNTRQLNIYRAFLESPNTGNQQFYNSNTPGSSPSPLISPSPPQTISSIRKNSTGISS